MARKPRRQGSEHRTHSEKQPLEATFTTTATIPKPDTPEAPQKPDHPDFILDLDGHGGGTINEVGWPLKKRAAKQMRKKGLRPVPDYTVIVAGLDAPRLINEEIRGIEMIVIEGETAESLVERVRVVPSSWVREGNRFSIRNPVPPERLCSEYLDWPSRDPKMVCRLLQADGDYIYF